jgi:hypothetical protein
MSAGSPGYVHATRLEADDAGVLVRFVLRWLASPLHCVAV